MIVINVYRHREQLVIRIGGDKIQEILGMRYLGIEPFHLFPRLDTLI